MNDKKTDCFFYDTADDHCVVLDSAQRKAVISPAYNYVFDKKSGAFVRWGRSKEDDPVFSPFGPELLDVEVVVDGCVGPGRRDDGSYAGPCRFCYKANTNKQARYMSVDDFALLLDKTPRTLTQVALGITGLASHPGLFDIMDECRCRGIVPNLTLTGADMTDDLMNKLLERAGAVAVSVYEGAKNVAYDTIDRLTKATLKRKVLVRRRKK